MFGKKIFIGAIVYFFLCVLLIFTGVSFGRTMLVFSLILYPTGVIWYMINSLAQRKERWSASVAAVAMLVFVSIVFKLMKWPGHGATMVIGASVLLMYTIPISIVQLVKKIPPVFPMIHLTFGFGMFFLMWYFLNWPGKTVMFYLFALAALATLVFVVVKRQIPMGGISIWTILVAICILFYGTTRRQYLYIFNIYEKNVYEIPLKSLIGYSWHCYDEGDIGDAIFYCEIAINSVEANQEMKQDFTYEFGHEPDFKDDLQMIEDGTWTYEDMKRNFETTYNWDYQDNSYDPYNSYSDSIPTSDDSSSYDDPDTLKEWGSGKWSEETIIP